MNLLEISKLAARTLVAMARDGTLAPAHIWTAIKGAEKYLVAAASGDKASGLDATRRVKVCDMCQTCTYESKPAAKAIAMYCGEAFKETDPPGPCGCLIGVMIEGVPVAGGKTAVASESCPAGKWGRVPPAK